MGFVLVVAAVAFGAELAVEGGHGFAGRGGLGLGEGLVAGRHVFCLGFGGGEGESRGDCCIGCAYMVGYVFYGGVWKWTLTGWMS